MNKKTGIVIAFSGLLFLVFAGMAWVLFNSDGLSAGNPSNAVNEQKVADKIEVLHFHATQQCWSCVTAGEYLLKTIQSKFPEEYKNGKIVFMSVNYELPENLVLVNKYRAGGTSVFINVISDGQDHISEEVTIWRLLSNENQFITYFQNKLNKLLGK